MAGASATDDSSASTAGMRDDDRSLSGESLSEWRSCDQGESGSPSTSPPFWDTDCDDDDPGPKPSELYGRHTWRIENFSKEKKREMKSEPFEAGGYKWYILVYPQGCDVSNHLSLFLCVANHDKLLPGWSHFAQFTIAVGNMDPKKIKYSDTLHRFWKKEHDWGWKKFMELSKIQDGFLVDDVLEIIAQVQVIREKVDRPFRCLDRPYRRELLRVYTTNIEQIYRRFIEERRNKITKLIEDKIRWSSFRAFWSAIDPRTRHRMSREKTDTILKVLVKHFFVEKEVTSTLVMDSLYTGLKALEYQSKGKKGRTKIAELDELPAPMVHVDTDIFVLASDVITLLEKAALEPLPCQPVSPKDDKCSQSRMKDGSSGEVNKISMEREERRLTELGRKILETFVLSHIFSGIEVAYQEAVALKRQEELIREEEAAGLENETKGKRGGGANEKDKRAKKKQAKQKKNNRKVKDKEREDKSEARILERLNDETTIDDSDGLPSKQAEEVALKVGLTLEESASDGPDHLDSSRPTNGKRVSSMEANNSSAFSTDSTAVNGIHSKINNLPDSRNHLSPNRGKNQRNKGISIISYTEEDDCLPSSSVTGSSDRNSSGCGTAPKLDRDTVLLTLKDRLRELGQRLHEKNIEGRKLFKAHFEAMESQTKTNGSSSSSSTEKPPDVLKSPDHSPEVMDDVKANETAYKDVPLANCVPEEAVSGTPATSSTEAVPAKAPARTKVDPVSNKDHGSSLTPQPDKDVPLPSRSTKVPPIGSKSTPTDTDKDVSLPSRSPRINRAAPVPPKSLPTDKATPVRPKSPPTDKATPVPPKSPPTHKATQVPPKSPLTDKATPVPPKSPLTDKATPVPPKSPLTDKAIPVTPKSTPTDRGTSVRPKSPVPAKAAVVPLKSLATDKANLVPPKSPSAGTSSLVAPITPPSAKDAGTPSRSPQVDKSIPAPPRLPQVDKAAPLPSGSPQTSSTAYSEAREEATPMKVTSTRVSEVAVTTSRPSSAPVFPTPRTTVPATPQVQVSTFLSRSASEAAGRSGNDPSPSAPAYVPQTYRNAILGKPGVVTTSSNLSYQPTTLGQGTALSQPLSTYASTASLMMPPAGRNDQLLSARHGFKSGLGNSDTLDSWQPWKSDSNINNHVWRDDSPYQRTTNGHAYQQTWKDDAYQQTRGTETENFSRFGGLQPPRPTPVSFVMQQPQAPVAEEYQHLDIINDLLNEEQSNGSTTEPTHHDYHAYGLPFSLRGNIADSEMASVSSLGRFSRGNIADSEMASVSSPGRFSRGNLADLDMASVSSSRRFSRGNLADSEMSSVGSPGRFSRGSLADPEMMASASSPGRFNSTDRYYGDGYSRAYDMSPLQGAREMQFSSLDTYATNGGLSDMSPSKPWLYGHGGSANPSSMNLGSLSANGFPQQHHQLGDYSNLVSGLNGVSAAAYRRQANNGRW
ncbi:MATH domain-containing protein [Hordeum vulgare]|uniref:MATH domain-containing protein n=1 Tax=Hordeum vulgare subsp. vulgare TaxID=112509 RepID=A0A8I6WL49_HORVV|nr:TNF receptor-associated factor homolog 1b-like isoform X2 [Hordeum vulgare subsp. vulgare]KAE8816335.1 MATH domain-containing protein [Hordeum vulgare]